MEVCNSREKLGWIIFYYFMISQKFHVVWGCNQVLRLSQDFLLTINELTLEENSEQFSKLTSQWTSLNMRFLSVFENMSKYKITIRKDMVKKLYSYNLLYKNDLLQVNTNNKIFTTALYFSDLDYNSSSCELFNSIKLTKWADIRFCTSNQQFGN